MMVSSHCGWEEEEEEVRVVTSQAPSFPGFSGGVEDGGQ